MSASDIEKALNVFHEYGILGYTPRSILINRFATQNPELAKSTVDKLINEFQFVADDDVKTSSAICGSIGNITSVDASSAIIQAIKTETNTRKRHCLFGVFGDYGKMSQERHKEIIDLALQDSAKEIQQTGMIWKKHGRILNTSEMSAEYERMIRENEAKNRGE